MPPVITSKTVDRVRLERDLAHFYWSNVEAFSGFDVKMPYHPGDILYVRETFFEHGGRFYYKADGRHEALEKLGIRFKWHPSIHMPREAARIFLRVTDVRVESLQDIDDDGVVAEGLEIGAPFDELWDSVIKKSERALYGWDANPWVWVIAFERCEKPEVAS